MAQEKSEMDRRYNQIREELREIEGARRPLEESFLRLERERREGEAGLGSTGMGWSYCKGARHVTQGLGSAWVPCLFRMNGKLQISQLQEQAWVLGGQVPELCFFCFAPFAAFCSKALLVPLPVQYFPLTGLVVVHV